MAGSGGRKLESELKVKKNDVNFEIPPKFGNKGGIPAPSKENSLGLGWKVRAELPKCF